MAIDRRALLALTAGGALSAYLALGDALAQSPPDERVGDNAAHDALGAIPDLQMYGEEQIAMLLYPGFTALDLVGPHYMFACMMGARVHLVTPAADLAPVASDLGLAIAPTVTFDDCPRDLDVLFTPGGLMGTLNAMRDPRIVAFVADRGSRARHITSVCTGSLVLGQAGLLRGKRATSHWAAIDTLPAFGATPVHERVVTDGNVVTGAGVSAGLDFGLALIGRLRGANYARAIQLQAEYAPAPPYDAGTLISAPPDVSRAMADMLAPFEGMVREVAQSAR
ncbi:MAG: DJ-1/PfpI family protein [Alphaproteobacteria bacterium]|nr:DJ-1/PfpI family protein [Alphaproteobacteria bacterium]